MLGTPQSQIHTQQCSQHTYRKAGGGSGCDTVSHNCHASLWNVSQYFHFIGEANTFQYFISILGIILATTKQQIMCTFWTPFLTSTAQHNTTQLVPVTGPPLQTPLSGKNITRTQASSIYSRKLDHPPGPSFSQDLPTVSIHNGKMTLCSLQVRPQNIFLIKRDLTNYSLVW